MGLEQWVKSHTRPCSSLCEFKGLERERPHKLLQKEESALGNLPQIPEAILVKDPSPPPKEPTLGPKPLVPASKAAEPSVMETRMVALEHSITAVLAQQQALMSCSSCSSTLTT